MEQSERTNNPDLVAPLLADKLISIDTDGSMGNRTKFLADAKAIKYSSVDIEGLHITVFGRTAVATMVLKAKGTDREGQADGRQRALGGYMGKDARRQMAVRVVAGLGS